MAPQLHADDSELYNDLRSPVHVPSAPSTMNVPSAPSTAAHRHDEKLLVRSVCVGGRGRTNSDS